MLEIDLRELARGSVETVGELAGNDPLFDGLDVTPSEPVRVQGRLQVAGEGRFYWKGSLHTAVAGACRRCLAPVAVPVTVEVGALFAQDPEAADDPDTYPVDRAAMLIDVKTAVREELLLALPRYLQCREDCRGLCPRCGKDLNAGPCGCAPPTPAPEWRGLEALRDKFHK